MHKQSVANRSRGKPITKNQAKMVADSQIWLREFNADFDQIVKRVSHSPTGLSFGAPPGTVT